MTSIDPNLVSFLNSGKNAEIVFNTAAPTLSASSSTTPAQTTPAQAVEMANYAAQLGSAGAQLSPMTNETLLTNLVNSGLTPAEAASFIQSLTPDQLSHLKNGESYTLYTKSDTGQITASYAPTSESYSTWQSNVQSYQNALNNYENSPYAQYIAPALGDISYGLGAAGTALNNYVVKPAEQFANAYTNAYNNYVVKPAEQFANAYTNAYNNYVVKPAEQFANAYTNAYNNNVITPIGEGLMQILDNLGPMFPLGELGQPTSTQAAPTNSILSLLSSTPSVSPPPFTNIVQKDIDSFLQNLNSPQTKAEQNALLPQTIWDLSWTLDYPCSYLIGHAKFLRLPNEPNIAVLQNGNFISWRESVRKRVRLPDKMMLFKK